MSDRQAEIVAFIQAYAKRHGQQSPTLQEIADGLCISKTSTAGHVNTLIAAGKAKRHDGKLWLVMAPSTSTTSGTYLR